MVTGITSNSFSQQISSQEFDADIKRAELLLDIVKKYCGELTKKNILLVLNEYIIRQTGNDTEGAKEIANQILSILTAYSNNLSKAADVEKKLETMGTTPTASGLAYLQNLILNLQKDVDTGDMSNLSRS